MAITQDDFKKVWASTSSVPQYTFSDTDYKNGWEFVGNLPPTRAMWDELQRKNDEKMQFLQENGSMCFDSVADMKSSNLDAGQTAFTKGYYSINDGGASVYNIRGKVAGETEDGGSVIFLENGNVAELITDGTVNVKQFGAKGDGTDTSTMFSNLHQFAVAKSLIEDYSGYTDYDTLFANLNGASVSITFGNVTISKTININNSFNYSKVSIVNTTFRVACDYVFTLSSDNNFFISFVFDNCIFIGDDTHLCYLFKGGSKDVVSPNCTNCCFDDVYLVDGYTRYLQSFMLANCRVQTKNRDFISSKRVIATKMMHLNMEAQPYRLINGCDNIDLVINDSVIEGLTNGVIKTANDFSGGGISVNNTYFEAVLYVLQINLPSTLSADSSYRFDFHNDEIIRTVLIDFNGTEKEDFGDHLFLRLSNSYLTKNADSYPSFITCGWRAIKNILVFNNKIVGYNQLFTNSYDMCIHNTETLPTNITGTDTFNVHYKYPESILVMKLDDGSFKYLVPVKVLSNGNYTYKNLFDPSEEFTSTTSKTEGVLNRYALALGSIHPLSVVEIPMGQLLVDMPLKNNLYAPLGYL